MIKPPLILVSPCIETKGDEFGDLSISLSETYQMAIIRAGGLPMTMPVTTSPALVAAAVRRADGVMLTGGEDINPHLYCDRLPARLRRTLKLSPDGGARDLRELMVVKEVFHQRKPLLAICRGHQILNIALGGTLVVDVRTQVPSAFNHARLRRKNQVVHDVYLTPDALLFKITGKRTLGVNSTHHQAIGRPAEPLSVAGRSNDGIIESMQLKPDAASLLPFLLSVQFHPERLADRYAEHQAIFSVFTRACVSNRRK
jgi:putative glutamine amidotransferase